MAREIHPRQRRSREVHPHRDGLCRWCSGLVEKPRVSWCSDRCVQEYLAGAPGALRLAVKKRDHEVCAACGRDCRTLRARLEERLLPFYEPSSPWPIRRRACRWGKFLGRLKLTRYMCSLRHLWEADHIVPVSEGGANELSNLRTLCLPCHKAETRMLAARRAKARRRQTEFPMEGA